MISNPRSTIYLDHAATTRLAPEVKEAMLPFLESAYGNPSSLYQLGQQSKVAIEDARRALAKLLHAEQGHLFFTSGGTEANNWAIKGLIEAHQIQHVLVSPIEHMSVLAPLDYLEQKKVIELHSLPLLSNGLLDMGQTEELIASFPGALVSAMHGNNEIGTLTKIKQLATWCHRHGVFLHSDMVQTAAYEEINLEEMGVDLATFSAHKFHGPKGIGALYVRDGLRIAPLFHGGKQEKAMRTGTEHVAGIIGMAAALGLVKSQQDRVRAHMLKLKQALRQGLKEVVQGVSFLGEVDPSQSLPSILHVQFPWDKYQETLLTYLDRLGIQVSSGSACMSGTQAQSHVVEALRPNLRQPVVRFSFSAYNTLTEIEEVIKKIGTL